ncbi:TPA: hypothetical protein ACGO28_001331 [Streptococcus suis]
MSDNKALDDFWEFVLKCLKDIKKTTIKNYKNNSINRKYNVFNCIEDSTISKYMGLGRSFDSKLGNEIQKIAMRLARVKYNDINVPNIILINTENGETDRSFSLNLYVIKDNFQQRVYYNIKPIDFSQYYDHNKIVNQKSIVFTLPKSDTNDVLKHLNKIKVTQQEPRISKYKNILVDLLYIEDIDDTTKTRITTFELKSGGNLDTKNSSANVKEVQLLKDIFKFFPSNDSFFATTYNNAGEGSPSGSVFAELERNNLEPKVGVDFWNMILPEELSYESFIEQYKQKFIESRIEAKFKRLDVMKYQTRKQFSKKRQKRKRSPKKYSKKSSRG